MVKPEEGQESRTEEALQKSIQLWHATFDALSEAIFLCDMDGKILLCNMALTKVLGKRSGEIIGRRCWEAVHGTTQPIDECPAVRMRRSRQREHLLWQRGDRWLDTVVDPMSEDERIVGYVHAMFDVTERIRAEQQLKDSAKRIHEMMDASIRAIASTLELRDPYTAGHERRVAQLACAIAGGMGAPEDQVEGIRIAAYVHDIGKIAVPAEILAKPGPITEHEFGIIKTHPRFGHDILKEIDFTWPVALVTLQHHERLNGSGYPQGLAGETIILEARIMAVADVVEAMCSHRPYRPALGIDKALEEITRNKGILYDPRAVEACASLFREKNFKFE